MHLELFELDDTLSYSRIALAMITTVIKDLQGAGISWEQRHKDSAEEFIFEEPIGDWIRPYSFLWLCDTLGICPQYIRRAYRNNSIKNWIPKRFDEELGCAEYFELRAA